MNHVTRVLGAAVGIASSVLPLQAQTAGNSPFFRFQVDRAQPQDGGGGSTATTDTPTATPTDGPSAGTTTDPGDQQPPGVLAFDSADALPSGPVGSPVRSYYVARGGTPPYAMALTGASPGIRLSKVATNTWAATGTLTDVGDYPNAKVTLTDGTTGAPTVLPESHTVSGPDGSLVFARSQNLPATFETYSKQVAFFGVAGGVAPYTWSLSNAPTTVVVSNSPNGSGSVTGMVESAGTYSGLTLTVNDAGGNTVSKTLDDFTVTDGGAVGLGVSGIDPLPTTMKAGDTFTSPNILVTGTAEPYHYVYGQILGGGGSVGPSPGYDFGNPPDPAKVTATFSPTDAGTYDVSIQFMDFGGSQKLVRWGTTTVTEGPFQAVTQFPATVTGKAGSNTTFAARVKGAKRDVRVGVSQPADLTAYGNYFPCFDNYHQCDTNTGVVPGESLVYVTMTFPKVGSYPGVQVNATDSNGQKVFFDPFTVVSTKPDPLTKVAEFAPNPVNVQGNPYGTSTPSVFAKVRGGSGNPNVTVTGPQGISLSGGYESCANGAPDCDVAGADPDMGLITLNGYAYGAGTYANIVVKADDPLSGTSLTFDPVTVNVSPPPLGSCAFKDLNSLSGASRTVRNAVTFQGGVAPYTVATDQDGVTYGGDTATGGVNHAYDATVAAGTPSGNGTVTVTDSTGATCSGGYQSTSYGLSSGLVPVVVQHTSSNPYSSPSFLVTSDQGQDATVDYSVFAQERGDGPTGAHPSPMAVVLTFVPPDGLDVTGYALATKDAPGGYEVVGTPAYQMYGIDQVHNVYTTDLNGTGAPFPLPSGDYRYQWYVFLTDGTYRLSTPFTIHSN